MEFREFSAKTVDDAITEALIALETTSDKIEYEVIEKGRTGLFSKPAVIKARKKENMLDDAKQFLSDTLGAMGINAELQVNFNQEDKQLDINMVGQDMGQLIGKRGQTLDSLQYLVSLVVNKNSEDFIRVKLDTENYRERRKKTLENLAKNIAFKVKKTRRSVALEPMNPYERRIIHSYLQNDKAVTTRSEGEEPYRKVVICLKKSGRDN